jgi:hypothetical protein
VSAKTSHESITGRASIVATPSEKTRQRSAGGACNESSTAKLVAPRYNTARSPASSPPGVTRLTLAPLLLNTTRSMDEGCDCATYFASKTRSAARSWPRRDNERSQYTRRLRPVEARDAARAVVSRICTRRSPLWWRVATAVCAGRTGPTRNSPPSGAAPRPRLGDETLAHLPPLDWHPVGQAEGRRLRPRRTAHPHVELAHGHGRLQREREPEHRVHRRGEFQPHGAPAFGRNRENPRREDVRARHLRQPGIDPLPHLGFVGALRLEWIHEHAVHQTAGDVERITRDHRTFGQLERELALQRVRGRIHEARGQRGLGQRPRELDLDAQALEPEGLAAHRGIVDAPLPGQQRRVGRWHRDW